jgi:hypothetical protein
VADSARTSIIANIVSTIAAITHGATYSRTVRTCSRNVRNIAEIPLYDAVWVERTNEVKSSLAYNVTTCTLTVTLGAVVQDYKHLGEAVDAIAADIDKALAVDITRGGKALDTRVVRVEEYVLETQEPLAGVLLDVEVTYRHRDGDPYTAC